MDPWTEKEEIQFDRTALLSDRQWTGAGAIVERFTGLVSGSPENVLTIIAGMSVGLG